MRGESSETKDEPRSRRWQEVEREVDWMVDGQGKRIDPGIKESVVALRVLGFETSGSCEGHLDHGISAPWIDIAYEQPVDKELRERIARERQKGALEQETERMREEVRIRIVEQQSQLLRLIDEFYTERRVPAEQRLIIHFYPTRSRIMSQMGEFLDIAREAFPSEVREKKLKELRGEMTAFTSFLRQKFIGQV